MTEEDLAIDDLVERASELMNELRVVLAEAAELMDEIAAEGVCE